MFPHPRVGYEWNGFDLYAAGDVTFNGKADILSINNWGDLYLYAGKGDGTFFKKMQIGSGWNGYKMSAGADINGDGVADIVSQDLKDRHLYF